MRNKRLNETIATNGNDKHDRILNRSDVQNMIEEALATPTERKVFMGILESYAKDLRFEVMKKGVCWVASAGVVGLLSLLLGWPGIKDALTRHLTRDLVTDEIRSYTTNMAYVVVAPQLAVLTNRIDISFGRIEELRAQVSVFSNLYQEASENVRLVQLEIKAEAGSLEAYYELQRLSKGNRFADELYKTVTSRQLLRLTDCSVRSCVNEEGFRYVILRQLKDQELFAIVMDNGSDCDSFNNAIKNLADRHENGEYLDFFVWFALHTDDLNRLRLSVDCIRYMVEFPRTISVVDIRNWWTKNKKPEYCHGIDAVKKSNPEFTSKFN